MIYSGTIRNERICTPCVLLRDIQSVEGVEEEKSLNVGCMLKGVCLYKLNFNFRLFIVLLARAQLINAREIKTTKMTYIQGETLISLSINLSSSLPSNTTPFTLTHQHLL